MGSDDMFQWRSIERWSAQAFMLAGLLWLADTVLLGLGMMNIYAHGLLNGVVILTALLATMGGLLGLYPLLADRVPRLALAAAVIGAVAAAGLVLAIVWVLGTMVLASVATPPSAFLLGTYVLPFLAIGLFGVLSIWIDVPSRTIGLLLVTYLIVLVGAVIASNELQFGLAGLVGLIALTVGYVHDTDAAEADRTESPADATA